MTRKKENSEQLQRLDEVLAVYGANPDRWPESERDALERFAHSDAEAARLLKEAVALEKVMSHAPAGGAEQALKDRIVAAAVADGSREARVVPMTAAARPRRGLGRQGTWWQVAAMAASFAVGVYLGVAGLSGNAFEPALNFAASDLLIEEGEPLDFFDDPVKTDSEGLI